MREQLNVKQKQAIWQTPAKGGGGLVETCFSSLGRMVAFPGKRPWLGLLPSGLSTYRVLFEACFRGSVPIDGVTVIRFLPGDQMYDTGVCKRRE